MRSSSPGASRACATSVAEGVWLRLTYHGRQDLLWQALAASATPARRIVQKAGGLELEVPLWGILALRREIAGSGRLHVLGHGGWPLVWRSWRQRPWRVAWPLAALLLYLAAASYVWQVAVVGPKDIPRGQILSTARQLGLRQGALRFGLDPFRLGQELQVRVPGLIFAAVRLDGVRAVIYAAPALKPPQAQPPAARGALFAAERGYVTRVVVVRGQPLVQAGQTVVRGDPLVAPRLGTSRGQVFARIWRQLSYRFPLRAERRYASGRRATRWYISWSGGRKWTPLGPGKPFPQARRQVAVWRIPLGSVEVARSTYVEMRTLKVVRSARYAELRATSLALATMMRSMPGARLLALRTKVRRSGGDFRVEVYIEAETDIAQAKAGGRTRD